ncbi:MAG: GNAT family N-acetyltransferase [Silicimonas sp.]|nr:GNAT family N-acetyltransferase [Silicimonas sp.]
MTVNQNEIHLRDIAIGDAGWLIQRHGELYAADEGFDASFEVLVAEILVDFLRNRDPETERGWIAATGKQRLGSIFCVHSGDPRVAKLRLFFVEPDARGLGLGRRLLEVCIAFARDTGNHTLRLWTHESHRAACALYAAYGFRCVASRPVHSFGVDLIEQTWELDLTLAIVPNQR